MEVINCGKLSRAAFKGGIQPPLCHSRPPLHFLASHDTIELLPPPPPPPPRPPGKIQCVCMCGGGGQQILPFTTSSSGYVYSTLEVLWFGVGAQVGALVWWSLGCSGSVCLVCHGGLILWVDSGGLCGVAEHWVGAQVCVWADCVGGAHWWLVAMAILDWLGYRVCFSTWGCVYIM